MSGVVLLLGTVGAGKTTTAYVLGGLLEERGVPHAVIDLDEIRRIHPSPPGDPFAVAVQWENLAAMTAVYRRAGAEKIILAGVLEGPQSRSGLEDAVGADVMIVRLAVDLATVRERLHRRHADGDGLDWHLERSGELEAILDADAVADVVIEVATESPKAVASRVLGALGW